MLDTPPKESEALSWAYVIAGALVIYCTIPVARSLRSIVQEHIGREYFLYVAAVFLLLAGFIALRQLQKRNLPFNAKLCLFLILSTFMGYLYTLRAIPEEAIHLTQYGVLGLLVFRALTHRMRDISIYIAAALVVGIVGIIDEYIQWLIPFRVFDLRDIRTNFVAGALTQAAIAIGLRPRLIRGMPSLKNWSRICFLSAATLLLLFLGFLNTPQRIAWYSTKIPYLSYLMNSRSMMVEYGYRFDDPDIGVFRSRFTKEQLLDLDKERGEEVGEILDRYIRGEGYSPFLSLYSVTRDPHTHEAGVHLFRREYHLDQAHKKTDKRGDHYDIAKRENQILAKYFPNILKSSRHYWRPELKAEVLNNAITISNYESKVSREVITRFGEKQIAIFFTTTIMILFLLGNLLSNRSNEGNR